MTPEEFVIPFIRHGQTLCGKCCRTKNVYNYMHDLPLDMGCKRKIYSTILDLVNIQFPDKIISSPFLCCRQTSEVIQKHLRDSYHIHVQIEIDRDLRDYLGDLSVGKTESPHSINLLKDISQETLYHIFGPETDWPASLTKTLIESDKQYEKRIDRITRKEWIEENVWVVTHGFIISALSHFRKNIQKSCFQLIKFN